MSGVYKLDTIMILVWHWQDSSVTVFQVRRGVAPALSDTQAGGRVFDSMTRMIRPLQGAPRRWANMIFREIIREEITRSI